MKRTTLLLAIAVVSAAFAAPAMAQSDKCTEEFKSATYQKWYDNRKGDQDVAYKAAKDYLATCTTEDQYSTALKKFVDAFDALQKNTSTNKQFDDAYKNKNYPEVIRLGKQVLATDPDNSTVYIVMGITGLYDESVLGEAAPAAKKAIELIDAGKPFKPLYDSKDKALAALTYVQAKALLKSAPADAIPLLLKTAKYESDLKKDPQLYLDLATAYNNGPRAVLTKKYTDVVGPTGVETPENTLALANLNQVIDRQIDALARAAALADAANKKAIMDALTEIYKYRNKTEAGLPEMVATVLSKPIPEVPTPLTSLPTPSTSGSPATSGAPGTTGAQTTGQNKAGSATVGGTGSAKPAATPTPSPKKPRANHTHG
jgi:tetratricopeptide (TPR) repeat protein